MSRYLRMFLALVALSAAGAPLQAQHQHQHQHGQPGPRMGRGEGMMGMRGMGMMGMAGDSATVAQMRVIHELVMNHAKISRTVTNLPDGIRTVTESDDPKLTQLLQGHVVTMAARVRQGDDPGLPMESPALRLIYREHDKIQTSIEPTAKGIAIVQTSADSAVVEALQQHAAEVSDLVARGRVAMHEAMMRHGRGAGKCRMQ